MLRRHEPGGKRVYGTHAKIYPGSWYVSSGPIRFDGREVDWGVTKGDEYVRVPMFSYTTKEKSLEAVFGFGVQLGTLAFRDVPKEERVDRMLLALGTVFDADSGYQVWLGLGFHMIT